MHELSVVMSVVERVTNIAQQQNLTQIDTLVLQIGEFSSMVPAYVESCYPAAVDNTIMQDTKLKIEILPANAICRGCDTVFPLTAQKGVCPSCGSTESETLGGKEFMIKEILAC